MEWQDRRVLVTGASGFIGAHLVRRLAELGADVHGASRSTGADLRDAGAVTALFATVRPEVVFHLAGEVNGARDVSVVRATLEGNLTATVNVLTAAGPGCRVVLAGSSEEPRPGNGHCPPPSPYAMAKAAATGYAELYHRLWGQPYTIVRPTMVYGPGQRDTAKLVPYVTLALLRGDKPRLTSGAKPVDWVYVDDVVEAFVLAGLSERALGQAFDVGTGTRVSVREAVELLYRIAGEESPPPFGTVPDRPLDVPQTADPGPALELIGWRPRTGLEEGLRRTVRWFEGLTE
ncbi:NAD-dependent epimerase/dehydratase family protein [Nonomuraea jiangxiensis]|uniref:Nucleoside-diphosphate-sugar epimerase n=1 Tax=Nonomuraea jiangxiensis TaxID=633440 RepID=A0A1G8ME44_9ACTN|nr:NAD-dependent epimerase/dehydratase family protein [Nonomuraea jiangxiensis]SDI66196.1 Nucleoside-diphosphate-sugar epimerase [Nonomuraea jiangxiensis]